MNLSTTLLNDVTPITLQGVTPDVATTSAQLMPKKVCCYQSQI